MKIATLIGVMLVVLSSSLGAQADPAGPRAGAWAAEVNFTGGTGAALLRFRNDRSAWLLGLDAQVAHESQQDRNLVVVGARFGARSLRSPGSPTRPIIGGGILGSHTQATGSQRSWDAGLYGEVGIARFFGASFSVGATSELQLRRSERRLFGQRSTQISAAFNVVRVAAAVYF